MDLQKVENFQEGPLEPEDVTSPANIEELSIVELDERLEFVAWCDNCQCQ